MGRTCNMARWFNFGWFTDSEMKSNGGAAPCRNAHSMEEERRSERGCGENLSPLADAAQKPDSLSPSHCLPLHLGDYCGLRWSLPLNFGIQATKRGNLRVAVAMAAGARTWAGAGGRGQ